jgi:segregation and condensation protein B
MQINDFSSSALAVTEESVTEDNVNQLHVARDNDDQEIVDHNVGREEWENIAADYDLEEREALVEALLFAVGAPVAVCEIEEATGLSEQEIEEALSRLQIRLSSSRLAGLQLVRVAQKYQLRTKIEFAPFIHRIRREKPKRLSRPALETLAIVAYRQPVTRNDMEKIRGVDCTPTLKTLLDRNLVRIVGYDTSVGQPALYATTDEFLHVFGLDDLRDLPTLRDVNIFEIDPGEDHEEGVGSDELAESEQAEGTDEEEAVDKTVNS